MAVISPMLLILILLALAVGFGKVLLVLDNTLLVLLDIIDHLRREEKNES